MRTMLVALGVVAGITARAGAQAPVFTLDFEAPQELVGTAGALLTYDAIGRVTTTGLAPEDRGAQGWSLSVGVQGGRLLEATTAGTAADLVENGGFMAGGFNFVELTTGDGNEGVVCAIVLTFRKPNVWLPPVGTYDLIRLRLEGPVPAPVEIEGDLQCAPFLSRVAFVDGRIGSGEPVENKFSWFGESFLPTLDEAVTTICPRIVRPLNVRLEVLEPGGLKGEPGPRTPWELLTPVGTPSVGVTAGVFLKSEVLDRPTGVQGWSFSVLTEPCFQIIDVTTDGTVADRPPLGYFTGGFNVTELVDPAKNQGQEGAVTGIVLSLRKGTSLPPVSDSLILKVVGSLDASSILAPGDRTSPCVVRVVNSNETGLIGSGEPVKTAISIGGASKVPGLEGVAIRLVGAGPSGFYSRGDANSDGRNNIADPIFIINSLFRQGRPLGCLDAADVNDDGVIDSSDAVFLVTYQFRSGSPPPPPPFPGCGQDPDGETDGIGCEEGQGC